MSVDLGHGRGWLQSPAAASIWRIDRQIGHPLQITEAGRSWAQQKAHWDTYQRVGHPIALHPDAPSIHQRGAAIDTDEGKHIHAVMVTNGWIRTVWRNGVLVEPWHWEYATSRDQHLYDTEPAHADAEPIPVIPEEEDEDMKDKYAYATINGKQVNAIYNTVSGYFQKFESADGEYNTAKAKGHEIDNSFPVTASDFASIEASCAAVRARVK